MSLPGGSGGIKKVSSLEGGKSLKELTKFKEEEPKSKLRYPEAEKKKIIPKKKNKKKVISKPQKSYGSIHKKKDELTTGIGSGGRGIGIGFGEEGTLSSFPYTYYVLLIRDKVSSNWYTSLISPGLSSTIRTVVYFRILRDGQITNLKIEESSGIKSFDLSALRAIYSAAPFPPLPSGFEGEYLGVHFIFEHSK
jgi:TonB family protein